MSDAVFLCFGDPDECQNCGGSASLGGTQDVVVRDWGRFCSHDCAVESHHFQAREQARAEWTRTHGGWCAECGYDNGEHSDNCVTMLYGGAG